MIEVLIEITGPRFCCGLVARNGRVIEMAPILRRHIKNGWAGWQVAALCRQNGWTWIKVQEIVS